jgi:hypothetical protein
LDPDPSSEAIPEPDLTLKQARAKKDIMVFKAFLKFSKEMCMYQGLI